MNAATETPSVSEHCLLLGLQRQALEYFLDNQVSNGLVLDRQRNRGTRCVQGLCSTATTGMGFVAIALASAPPHRLLSPRDAGLRVQAGVRTALEHLAHDHGILPHFVDFGTGNVVGADHFSTVDSAWLIAGALWAAEFLQDPGLEALARRLYERVDWNYWTGNHPEGLVRHGKDGSGRFLPCAWDRLNGETVFLYVLAAGAEGPRGISSPLRQAWKCFRGAVAGHHFNHADLGLFVFQYGLDLLDLSGGGPAGAELHVEARLATLANHAFCRHEARRYATYRRFWGLSAGDGPGDYAQTDAYRAYAPSGPVDGTAHLTATLASIAHHPEGVLANLLEAERDPLLQARGRYGFSNVNLDRSWIAQDMVGIDAGAAALAVDNFLMGDRVRRTFHRVPCVARGLQRLGFAGAGDVATNTRQAS